MNLIPKNVTTAFPMRADHGVSKLHANSRGPECAQLDTARARCVAETSRRDHANSDAGSFFTSRCILHPLRLALGAHRRAVTECVLVAVSPMGMVGVVFFFLIL